MERRLHAVESPFAPDTWPSIARASAELRRPRRFYAVRDAVSAPSPLRLATADARTRSLAARRR